MISRVGEGGELSIPLKNKYLTKISIKSLFYLKKSITFVLEIYFHPSSYLKVVVLTFEATLF